MWPALAFKQIFGLGLDLSVPLANLNWMVAVLLGYLVDGLHSTERLHSHLGLELRRMNSSLI
jgi:hypothetical protein